MSGCANSSLTTSTWPRNEAAWRAVRWLVSVQLTLISGWSLNRDETSSTISWYAASCNCLSTGQPSLTRYQGSAEKGKGKKFKKPKFFFSLEPHSSTKHQGSPKAVEGGVRNYIRNIVTASLYLWEGFLLLPRGSPPFSFSPFLPSITSSLRRIFISCPAFQVFPQTGICSRPLWSTPQLLVRKKKKKKKKR